MKRDCMCHHRYSNECVQFGEWLFKKTWNWRYVSWHRHCGVKNITRLRTESDDVIIDAHTWSDGSWINLRLLLHVELATKNSVLSSFSFSLFTFIHSFISVMHDSSFKSAVTLSPGMRRLNSMASQDWILFVSMACHSLFQNTVILF